MGLPGHEPMSGMLSQERYLDYDCGSVAGGQRSFGQYPPREVTFLRDLRCLVGAAGVELPTRFLIRTGRLSQQGADRNKGLATPFLVSALSTPNSHERGISTDLPIWVLSRMLKVQTSRPLPFHHAFTFRFRRVDTSSFPIVLRFTCCLWRAGGLNPAEAIRLEKLLN